MHELSPESGSKVSRKPRRLPRWAGAAAALWTAFQVTACDSPTDPGNQIDPTDIRITEVSNLAPGQTAQLSGQNLDQITGLVVDGQPVTFVSISSTRGEFTTPSTRNCEVDSRRVGIVANGNVQANGRMEVSSALDLEVGESVILSAEELGCAQLGRGMEAYLLSMANFDLNPGGEESLFRLNLRGTGETPSVSFSAAMADAAGLDLHAHHDHHHDVAENVGLSAASVQQQPFDDYANAQVGDTVLMVDWLKRLEVEQAQSKEGVPQFEAVVVAAEGDQLIVADLRTSAGRRMVNGANQENLQRAARMVSEVAVPAIKHLIGPEFETPPGAGGRMITLLEDRTGLATGSVRTPEMFRDQRWASNMFVSLLDVNWAEEAGPNALARIIAHETGHLADAWAFRDIGGHVSARTSGGFHQEAFAVTAEDLMARMSRGGTKNVDMTMDPDKMGSQIRSNPHPNPEVFSAWGTEEGRRSAGWYTIGGRILRYAQEQMPEGEEWRLHRALLNRSINNPLTNEGRAEAWGIQSIAEEIGTTPEQLVEDAMLADLTHGIIDPGVAEQRGLPQNVGWRPNIQNVQQWLQSHRKASSRMRDNESGLVKLLPGSYDYRYIAGDHDRGLAIEAEDVNLKNHHQVRLTRLR